MTAYTIEDVISGGRLHWSDTDPDDIDMGYADREVGRYLDTAHLSDLLREGRLEEAGIEAEYLGLAFAPRQYSIATALRGSALSLRLVERRPSDGRWIEPVDGWKGDLREVTGDTQDYPDIERAAARLLDRADVDPKEVTGYFN